MIRIDIATLFPTMCDTVLSESIIGRARKNNKVEINCVNIRDYSMDKFHRVDDSPYGGGNGMIMQAEPLFNCIEDLKSSAEARAKPLVIYLSPKGKTFNQSIAKELAKRKHLIFVCGHYEGVDQRFIDECVDMEISIGDYVLTGGELGALVVSDAIIRLQEGVLSDPSCYQEESHYNGLLEYPQYTRPPIWHKMSVPDVLLSGNHKMIQEWKMAESKKITEIRRPDMLKDK